VSLNYGEHTRRRHAEVLAPNGLQDRPSMTALWPTLDGYMPVNECAVTMGITDDEVVTLAQQGALDVRGHLVRPALLSFITIRQ
jgi:hypothetical protein